MMMNDDLRIESTIAIGKRNKEVMALVHNWCKHARIEKCGGTGLIELETGLPIGHHRMACDNAAAGGMGTWHLADAAIDFYDRNCANCSKRVPVRLPNLSSLVSERDAQLRRAAEELRVKEEKLALQLATRQARRQALRSGLAAVSASIFDFIDEIDRGESEGACEKLLGAAKLAPETFTPAIVEYLFVSLESHELWIDEIGLKLLQMLSADPSRLANCAMRSLGKHASIVIACEIIQANADLVDESLIPAALPALVWRAEPERALSFSGGPTVHDPRPLVAIHRAFRLSVEKAIGLALDERAPYRVSVGGRAVIVLAENSDLKASVYARSLAAKLARAHILIERRETGYHGDDEAITHLQTALALALAHDPETTDKIIAQFIEGAPAEGEMRLCKVYAAILNPRRGRGDEERRMNPAALLALRRLIGITNKSLDYEILRVCSDAFSHMPEVANTLARKEMVTLLGAAILLDDRINSLAAQPHQQSNFVAAMEQSNLHQLLYTIQGSLIEWAAQAASDDLPATEEFLSLIRDIPEGNDDVRSVLVSKLHEIMKMPAGLNAALPALYAAMLHTSTLVRAAASKTIKDMNRVRREDMPDLLYEAFVMHLFDPYIIVHKAAVRTLQSITLPKNFEISAKVALRMWIDYYAVAMKDEKFLFQCIEIYLSRYAQAHEKEGGLGRVFVALLERLNPDVIARDLEWLVRELGSIDACADLVIKTLADERTSEYQQEYVLSAVNVLTVAAIQKHKSQLVAIAIAQPENRELASNLIETLTRSGAWTEAVQICQTMYGSIHNTVERMSWKLYANLDLIATRYEEAIALGQMDALSALSKDWKETERQIEQLRAKNAKISHSFPSIPGTY